MAITIRKGALALAAVLGAAGLTLTACGGGSSTNSGSSSSANSAPSSPASTGSAPGSPPVIQSVHVGQAFTISFAYASGQQAAWKVTVTSLRCGQGSIDLRAVNASRASDGEPPVASAPSPPAGQQWCTATANAVNQGTANDSWNLNSSELLIGANRYAEDDTAPDPLGTYDQAVASNSGPLYGVNPGQGGTVGALWQVPAGSHPSLLVPMGTAVEMIGGPSPVVEVTP